MVDGLAAPDLLEDLLLLDVPLGRNQERDRLADGVVELKRRATGEKQTVPLAQALEIIG